MREPIQQKSAVAPLRVRELKHEKGLIKATAAQVAPLRVRELKHLLLIQRLYLLCRTFTGA